MGGMNERKKAAVSLLAAATIGLALTYVARTARARLRKPVAQAMTVFAPRERVEQFIETRERMLEVLPSRGHFGNIDYVEVRDAPAERGTEIVLSMLGLGKYEVRDILRRAKWILEAGEIPTGRRHA